MRIDVTLPIRKEGHHPSFNYSKTIIRASFSLVPFFRGPLSSLNQSSPAPQLYRVATHIPQRDCAYSLFRLQSSLSILSLRPEGAQQTLLFPRHRADDLSRHPAITIESISRGEMRPFRSRVPPKYTAYGLHPSLSILPRFYGRRYHFSFHASYAVFFFFYSAGGLGTLSYFFILQECFSCSDSSPPNPLL